MDNLDYNSIREAFDPCSVAITEDGVTLILHPDTLPVATLMINEEEMHNGRVFEDLVSRSREIRISLDPAGKTEFQFCFPIPVEKPLHFSPLRHDKTYEAIEDALKLSLKILFDGEPGDYRAKDYSILDSSALEQRAEELRDLFQARAEENVRSPESADAWRDLEKEAKALRQKWEEASLKLTAAEDAKGGSSTAEFSLETDHLSVYTLSPDATKQLLAVANAAWDLSVHANQIKGVTHFNLCFST